MFERFTDRARRVVVLGQEESRRLDHDAIGTEHLLLGIVEEGEGVAAQALVASGIPLASVRREVERMVGRGDAAVSGHIPFTPRAKKVLELSMREALQLGHNYVGTEHVLLGLVHEGEGVAAQVLVKLGADLSELRQQVIRILTGHQGAGVAPELIVDRSTLGAVVEAGTDRPPPAGAGGPLPQSLGRLVLRRFTVSSCRVLLLAESEALRLGHTTVGPEHLLLGLLAEGDGGATAALGGLGVDLPRARRLAEQALGRRTVAGPVRASYGDDALDALERALVEALGADSSVVDTAHLLLGLVQQAERGVGLSPAAFGALGTSADAVRAAVADRAAVPGAPPGADSPPPGAADPAPGPGDSPPGRDDPAGGSWARRSTDRPPDVADPARSGYEARVRAVGDVVAPECL